MKKLVIASLVSVGFVMAAMAATETVPAVDATDVAAVSAEVVAATETVSEAVATETSATVAVGTSSMDASALTAACGACHGADGNSGAPNYPKLAGQNVSFLLKQMKDIKSGARSIPAMTGQLDAMNDAQMAEIAKYYSKQTRSLNQAQDKYLDLGEKVYRIGNASKGLPACTGCHSPTGHGNAGAGFPSLGGQHAAYIDASLRAFREGSEYADKGRKNDEMQGVMRDIASRMSDKEIEAVSNFISGLYQE